ncbi:4Fe-4S cluster-binding domain-containing protein [bacterium]|nr:4Fe-4S cluster-binding domain-containing protein [bacterium]
MYPFISVNYHLTKNCNMFCKGCFARYKELSDNKDYISTLKEIVRFSNINNIQKRKINFVGGEPTLLKNLPELVKFMSEK